MAEQITIQSIFTWKSDLVQKVFALLVDKLEEVRTATRDCGKGAVPISMKAHRANTQTYHTCIIRTTEKYV